MKIDYIANPPYVSINDILSNNYSLSAKQFKVYAGKNTNVRPLKDLIDRPISNKDLGVELGSECYVDVSDKFFMKTKALQSHSYLPTEGSDNFQCVITKTTPSISLEKGDLIISKDSNVGEIIILDKDYPNVILCGALYKLPISKYKYYVLAFVKSEVFRQQVDFVVPKGSTIRHGKTLFFDCLIPFPDNDETIKYVEVITEAIVNKQTKIRENYEKVMSLIENELKTNQKQEKYIHTEPSINDILTLDRMDSSLYSYDFKQKEFLITNYINGTSTIYDLGFLPSRGQNLQVSNIGKSIQTDKYEEGYYKLILPKFLSKYGTVMTEEYLGNSNKLKTIKKGEIIFGAEGNEKGRSLVVIEEQDKTITNIHGITLTPKIPDIQKSVFVKLFLDYYRSKGMIDDYAVGGNGGSLAIKYWNSIKFPNFSQEKINEITVKYHNLNSVYDTSHCMNIEKFIEYDSKFNETAGILELDNSVKYLQSILDNTINKIVNGDDVEIAF